MYHIITEQERNPKPCLFHRDLLQSVDRSRVSDPVIGADLSGAQVFFMEILLGGSHQAVELFLGDPPVKHHVEQFIKTDIEGAHQGRAALLQLPYLFLQSHFGT